MENKNIETFRDFYTRNYEHLEKNNLCTFVFDKGFLITNDLDLDLSADMLFQRWRVFKFKNYNIWLHPKTTFHSKEKDGTFVFFIGHAFDPINNIIEEENVIDRIIESRKCLDCLNTLTGIFFFGMIEGDNFSFTLDASGMQYGCYSVKEEHIYVMSHSSIFGDIFNAPTDPYVKRLINYKFYKYMLGNYLPGDLTKYSELKRIIPNTMIKYYKSKISINRFYPSRYIDYVDNQDEYESLIKQAADILKNTMLIISKKWKRPSISLTGGIDSNTTFAAANGIYDKFSTFSYVSMYRESIDAEAAKKIANHFNVEHTEILVPNSNEQVEDFNVFKRIFEHNGGDIGQMKDNDVRKKITLIRNNVCDVEVKSWISETIRAYAYKYFGRKSFPQNLKPRCYSSLYKIFIHNRKLLLETDKRFAEYLDKTDLKNNLYNYDESDFFVWEMMHGGKCGIDITVMKSCFDITIPYNNRALLDLLLRIPLQKRIDDIHHLDMKKYLNKELFDMNIRVVNLNETNNRKKILNLIYLINTHLPF